ISYFLLLLYTYALPLSSILQPPVRPQSSSLQSGQNLLDNLADNLRHGIASFETLQRLFHNLSKDLLPIVSQLLHNGIDNLFDILFACNLDHAKVLFQHLDLGILLVNEVLTVGGGIVGER